jgi:hypothetical protein
MLQKRSRSSDLAHQPSSSFDFSQQADYTRIQQTPISFEQLVSPIRNLALSN